MQTPATNTTLFPTILFMLAVIAVPVLFIAIAGMGIEGELLTLLSV